jgi:hypothetical protein
MRPSMRWGNGELFVGEAVQEGGMFAVEGGDFFRRERCPHATTSPTDHTTTAATIQVTSPPHLALTPHAAKSTAARVSRISRVRSENRMVLAPTNNDGDPRG